MRRRVVRGIDPRRIGVVLVDDSADIRWLTRTALERDGSFQVVGEAGDGDAGAGLALACGVDVVLLDLALPDALDAVARLHREAPLVAVVLHTLSLRAEVVQSALALGALGAVRKGAPLNDVVAQLRAFLAARRTLPPVRSVGAGV